MRMFMFLALFFLGGGFWLNWFIKTGQMDEYLDKHPNPKLNAPAEYYWGMALELAGHKEAASARFRRVYSHYPETDYGPIAWAELINIAYEGDDRDTVIAEAKSFLEQYPDHSSTEIIRKKLMNTQNGF